MKLFLWDFLATYSKKILYCSGYVLYFKIYFRILNIQNYNRGNLFLTPEASKEKPSLNIFPVNLEEHLFENDEKFENLIVKHPIPVTHIIPKLNNPFSYDDEYRIDVF